MQTNQSKFPIGWVFAIVAAIAMELLMFFSHNFQYLGEKTGSGVIWSIFISILLLVIVGILVKAKLVPMPLNFRKAAVLEVTMLLVYIVLIFVVVLLTNHFYVVMGNNKDIKQEVTAQINQIDTMFISYNSKVEARVDAYEKYLKQVQRNKNSNYARYVSERLNEYSIEDLVINFKGEIDCGDIEQDIKEWKNDMLNKTNGLGLITLMPRIKEINENLNKTLDELKTLDRKSEKGLNGAHWDYTLTVSNDILKYFGMSDEESFSIWAFLATIIAALVMLLPYFAADRDGRHKGLWWELMHSRETSSNAGINITGV